MNRFELDIRPRPGGTHAVLVAAGQSSIRLLLACTLADERYRLHEEETEEAAVTQAQISRPALVVLDSELAQGDGIAACRRIKENHITRDTVVVVISSKAEEQEHDRAMAAGADAFLTKPFSPSRLLHIAAEVCGARCTGALDGGRLDEQPPRAARRTWPWSRHGGGRGLDDMPPASTSPAREATRVARVKRAG